MTESVLVPAGVLALLLASAAGGAWLQLRLPERHRSRETTDAVRAATGIVITFAAVVLGLLINGAVDGIKQVDGHLRGYAVMLIQLDGALREYGADADPLRQTLRAYTAAAIADTWKGETPPGDYYPHPVRGPHHGQVESVQLGRMLSSIEVALRRLDPPDPFHQSAARAGLAAMDKVLDRRWGLIQSAQVGVSTPFLVALLVWLVLVFACFGLTAPRNVLAHAVIGLCAVVLASAVFLLIELEYPFSGLVAVSSEPFRDALEHVGQ